jgi:hypothetical protein
MDPLGPLAPMQIFNSDDWEAWEEGGGGVKEGQQFTPKYPS